MLVSIPHFPSSHHFCSKTLPNPSRLSPSFSPSSTLCLKNPKPHTPHCRSSSSSHSSSSQEAAARSAIQRISEKLRSLGYLPDDSAAVAAGPPPPIGSGSAGEIFIPTPHEIPKHRVGHTIDPSWSTPERPVPEPGSGATITRFRELWKRERESSTTERKEARVPTVAELMLPRKELKRLTTLGIALTKRLKVGKTGITEGIVNAIHERWRRSEVVKIKCDDLCRMNMKRTHEILERKTGGLVVWRSGNSIVLYRGTNYQYPYFHIGEHTTDNLDEDFSEPTVGAVADMEQCSSSSPTNTAHTSVELRGSKVRSPFVAGVGSPNKLRFQLPGESQLEEEADRLLDGLGPRFTDWWGYDPLPVDGDLLPAIVPEFRKPFRLLPFGLKPKLTDRELTILRRLSRHLPCHFALGRNRNLQGLAVSIIKLWEKCELAKIAVKRGAQNTNSEIMAEELKKLIGGTLLSRDKDFIVFYRGKDFLPPAVSIAIEERRNLKSGDKIQSNKKVSHFVETQSSRVGFTNPSSDKEPEEAAEQKRSLVVLRNAKKVEAKLNMVTEKIERSEKHLVEIEKLIKSSVGESDKEGISKEERYMLRRVGLRMKPFLLLGRRGVFDGTIENMHLHWKYRELVKIIHKDRCIEDVESDARTLEAESGGILVAVERVSKGHAIVIYRGKNYQRPINLRPKSLLNKKEALKRSLEAQRYESLKLHALCLSKTVDHLDHQTTNNDLDTDTSCLSEFEGSNSSNEISDKIGPLKMEENSGFASEMETNRFAQSHFNGEHIEEVNAVNAAGYGNIPHNMETVIAPNQPDSVIFLEHQYEFPKTESLRSTSVSISEGESLDDSCASDANLSSGQAQSSPGTSSLESNFEKESDVGCFFRPAPLSNRERLLLRKQALKMEKRPVLAVGRNNILTGVAKTIKTHFKKYPLAIVNIKGRAKGTSVQELVFELEQATESILVSREPNKVILYRGWGVGDEPGGLKKKDANKTSMEAKNGVVSPQLIAAIRRECGLPTAYAQ